jgi:hypothetical protein
MCKINKRERCNDIERQNEFSNTSEKISLAFYYWEVKHGYGKESHICECTRKERMGIIWLKGGISSGSERGRCPL